MPTAIVKCH